MDLRAYVIWLPIRKLDDRNWAIKGTRQYADARVKYFWDRAGITGKIWQEVLDLQGVAWDVYFLYRADETWDRKPTQPGFWMHQLSHASGKAPTFDRETFEEKTREFLTLIHN